jgi:hypothetical protein
MQRRAAVAVAGVDDAGRCNQRRDRCRVVARCGGKHAGILRALGGSRRHLARRRGGDEQQQRAEQA